MKIIQFTICLCIAYMASSQTVFAQDRKDKKQETAQKVRNVINSNRFKIEVDRMTPMSGPSKMLTPEYSVEVRNDSVYSRLPYFGRAYNIPYGGGEGLIFSEPLNEYIAKYHRKGKVEIKFVTRNEGDKYTYQIVIYPNSSTTININSTNRQPISYQGELILP